MAMLARDDALLLGSVAPNGLRVYQTGLAGKDLSWSPDGQYLTVRKVLSDPSDAEILKFPVHARSPAEPAR